MLNLLMPVIALVLIITAKLKKLPVLEIFREGATDGLRASLKILPVLLLVVSASAFFRASGAVSLIGKALEPVCDFFGVPAEVIPLAVLRPISGGGSIACMSDIIASCGVDSTAGLIAAVMCSSTDTTLYAVAVYTRGRKFPGLQGAAFAALSADFVAFAASVAVTKLFFGI